MTKKLTKNDSMLSRSEKHDVAVAAFEALLGKNRLWKEYMTNFNHSKLGGTSTEIYTDWKAWASFTPLYQWCCGAFVWQDTPQEHDTWRDFDYEWHRYICRNLNK